jgi:hypothetical protein
MYSYKEINADRFNELHKESNELLARIASSIMLYEIDRCDNILDYVSGNGDFQYSREFNYIGGKGIIKIGTYLSPIRQSDKFLFTSGTLDISLGEHTFVKIRVHKGLNSCTTSVSKCYFRYITEERNIIKGILSFYMDSSGIARDSDLYKAYLDYISMLEEMSVILGF